MSSKIEQIYALRFKGVTKREPTSEEQAAYTKAFYQLGGAIAGVYPTAELTRLMEIFKAIGGQATLVLNATSGEQAVSVEEAERALYNALLQFVLLLCEDSERLGGIMQAYTTDILQLGAIAKKLKKPGEIWESSAKK